MKKILIPIIKGGVAVGLVYWLIATKKITAEPFIQLWGTPFLTFFVFLFVMAGIVINNYRWLLLLQGQKIRSSLAQTMPLTFIGLFFNLAMPGSVGGDVIKAYYIAQEQPGTKLRAATSVLMDRVVGLYAMALIALAALLTHTEKILSSPQLRSLAIFIVGLSVGFTVFFIIGFSDTVRTHDLTEKFLNKIPAGKMIRRIYDAVHDFRHGKTQFLWGIVLSILVQSLNIFGFYVISVALHFNNVSFGAFFFLIPLGLIATAIPVSPGGVGVGQAVFLALFNWYGGVEPSLGPTLITIYQVMTALISLIGAVLYFMRKNHGAIPQNVGQT
jgi:glycosyltransferase 2 family protein